MKKQKVVVIVGQTASGKTALSLELAQKIGAEIISADSRQVYLGMDLGSGKVNKEEQAIALHRLLDVADPRKDVFTVADFVEQGSEILDKTLKRAVTPIIVGGTFLYVDALLGKIAYRKLPRTRNFEHRSKHAATTNSLRCLHKKTLVELLRLISIIAYVSYVRSK